MLVGSIGLTMPMTTMTATTTAAMMRYGLNLFIGGTEPVGSTGWQFVWRLPGTLEGTPPTHVRFGTPELSDALSFPYPLPSCNRKGA